MLSVKNRIVLSLTVFSMFFGAGNLIFPPFLGYEAGFSFFPAFLGFAITAIGLPVLALLAVGRSGSLEKLGDRVHPVFSVIYTVAIYLSIGPCLAIPRTASTSFEMVESALGIEYGIFQIIYSVLFFVPAFFIALNPEKLNKTLGRILCPILLILIAVIFIGAITIFTPSSNEPLAQYADSPFTAGFTDGYQTMDAIAGLVFGIILFMNLENLGVDKKDMRKESTIASIGGGIIFIIVYSAIAFIGIAERSYSSDLTNGADILSAVTGSVFGTGGKMILSVIFIIACFNTCVSLLSSCGAYFEKIIPQVSRRVWILIFAVISCVISNAGLDRIIALSSPILTMLYPAAIMLIAISFMHGSENMKYIYRVGIATTLIFSLLQMTKYGAVLPLYEKGLGWFIPALIGTSAGYFIDRRKRYIPH